MKRLTLFIFVVCIIILLSGCKENYSNGEKVGNLIEFTKKGVIWDSWEGRLNLTQTGMNTAQQELSIVQSILLYLRETCILLIDEN